MIKLATTNGEISLHICDLNGETFHPVISFHDAGHLAGLLDHVGRAPIMTCPKSNTQIGETTMWCALSKALDAEAKRVQAMSKDDLTKEDLIEARQKLHEAEARVEELETRT